MQERDIHPWLETLRLAIPFICILAFGLFRLHSVLAVPRRFKARLHRLCGTDELGTSLLNDPYERILSERRRGN